MAITLKVTTIGNSTGVILPKEVLTKLGVDKGDHLIWSETPEGYRVSAFDPDFQRQLELARKGMRRYRNALRELAK
jgi:putative addiction module antidote